MVKNGGSYDSNESGAKMRRSKMKKSGKARGAHPPDNKQHAISVSTKKRKIRKTSNTMATDSGTTGAAPKRTKEKPARFTHPRLQAELRRLDRAWLSPGDPLFESALEESYRGMRHLPRASLPRAVHKGFRRSFDALHDAGLFLYDTVQAGGKRLSRTFVTRTLLGDPGITYKYLGLRLFAHPWDREGDFRKGPGDALANALNDPCLADLFSSTTTATTTGAAGGTDSINVEERGGPGVGDALRKVGDLSEWMRVRAAALLKDEGEGRHRDGDGKGAAPGGSCDFNLTLINRMECSVVKRDLKPDPLFAMGKCSVSWHADSCLEDFSTIGVYHCTEPASTEADWGIALRVSKEAKIGGDMGGGDAASIAELGRKRERESAAAATVVATASERGEEEEEEKEKVLTPPLLVPLQSGDAYFLLDDFNHFHEHAVVSGSCSLRYSSTHRVASTEGNTFWHVQRRCEEVLAGGGDGEVATDSRLILNLAQVRAEQALLTELESEWLNQFWVQGRRHATLHPWWRGPMALVLATWRELERRTAATVRSLLSLQHARGRGGEGTMISGDGDRERPAGATQQAEPVAVARAFDTVLRALEERRESRSRWDLRFADSAYRSLPSDCSPVVPEAVWGSCGIQGAAGGGVWEQDDVALPKALGGVICRVRECYSEAYRAASGGKKAGSAKAIAAGAASNWELFQQQSAASGTKGLRQQKKQQQQ